MIIVTGATGALNGSTVDHLLDRVPAQEITVVARDVAKAQRFADRGVAVRYGDYREPDSLPAAFEGAHQLLLVSSNDLASPIVPQHRAAIDAAVSVGVGRILYTSHQGAAPDSPFVPARDHFATEQMLADSGVAWTSLRNGFYAHSLAWLLGRWAETGRITVPGEGPVSWTSREDAGEAAAVVLTSGTAYDGPTTITAGAAPTFEEVAVMVSERAGRTVTFEVADPEEWVAAQVSGGQPEFMARFLLGMYRAAEEGFFAGTDPLLKTLIGREPATVRDVLAGLIS
ncbi:NAD(P)H-binding protein [Kineosporia mesophila]|uniref:NAD(P)H-binding protein n=1 Tax=Kineosporia mesophila TaxID=566012 RepID=A0ABP7AQR9_9ACTN|nr:SDR family oxidoreductase [Kineosporia mesophila]MCD5349068.1 SDR family oxidoreductase [Kineosporia mesophila]